MRTLFNFRLFFQFILPLKRNVIEIKHVHFDLKKKKLQQRNSLPFSEEGKISGEERNRNLTGNTVGGKEQREDFLFTVKHFKKKKKMYNRETMIERYRGTLLR